MNLYLDTETFSTVDLKTRGTAAYATQVEVMIVTWAVDDGPVQMWDRTRHRDAPPELFEAAKACTRVLTHNVTFDRTVIEHDLPDLGRLLTGKWYCTMAQALRHGLPGGLDKLSIVLKLPDGKFDGKAGIQLFCKPARKRKGSAIVRNTYQTHPREWIDFCAYAKQDIVALRLAHAKMPKWNDTGFEHMLWDLDQTINRRGIAVDVPFATAAVRATKDEQADLAARTREATDGVVDRATQRDKLLAFLLVEHGVDLPDLRADTIDRRLEDPELPEYVKELLRLRLSSSKSSTSKYKRLLDTQVAGRLYHLLQYCGAQRTGRWAGRTFQPQNLKRPTLKFPEIEAAIAAVLEGTENILVDDIMEAMSSAIRSALIAGPGRKLVVSDLSNIEGRGLAWIAGEDWKLRAFADFDAGTGPDLYVASYARAFGVSVEEVDKLMRQIGKVMELALGYEGGVGAFVTMAATYGMDLDLLAERALPTFDMDVLRDAEDVWQWAKRKGRTLGLPQRVYVAAEGLKRLWRDGHPATIALWHAASNAAKAAVLHPGTVHKAGRLEFDRKGAWLRLRLPSGRYLLYPNPKVDETGTLSYAAWNVYRRAWCHEPTYGGKLIENGTQGLARDVMAYAMPEAELAGYPIVLTVHDELVTEPEDSDEFTAAGLSEILSTPPAWAQGLPLAAKGFETQRYRKDD